MKKLIAVFIITCFCCNLFAQNIPSYVPTNGLVAWYPFNGNANDESGNGNNGVVNGTTILTFDKSSIINSAYAWDGTNSPISILNNTNQNFQSGVTFSVWLYQTSMYCSSCASTHYLTKGRDINPGGIAIGLDHPSQKFCFRITGSPVSTNPPYSYFLSSSNINYNTWINLTGTYDGNVVKIYINGILDISYNYISSIPLNAEDILIGKQSGTSVFEDNYNMLGKLDDIAIYNRALSQEEITSLYQGSSTNNVTNGSVGINTTSPHPSAALDITDTQRGLLIPRMTASQRNEISNPAEGLMVFQTDDSTGFWYYSGQKWNTINSKGIKGDQGLQGLQGVKGDSGISVSNTSVQGDSLYITLSNGQTINAGNVRGLTGAQGEQGLQGTPGILPNGSSAGNTPYWNGTSWVTSSSNIYNNGTAVGINTSSPNASAALDISDTARGLLIPRMTMNQRNAIQNPAEGLMVYQTDSSKGFYYFSVNSWYLINANNTLTSQSLNLISSVGGSTKTVTINGVSTTQYIPSYLYDVGNCSDGDFSTSGNYTLLSTFKQYCNLRINIGDTLKLPDMNTTFTILIHDTLVLNGCINGSSSLQVATNAYSNSVTNEKTAGGPSGSSTYWSSNDGTVSGKSSIIDWYSYGTTSVNIIPPNNSISVLGGYMNGNNCSSGSLLNAQDVTENILKEAIKIRSELFGCKGASSYTAGYNLYTNIGSLINQSANGGNGGNGLYIICKYLVYKGNINLSGKNGITSYSSAGAYVKGGGGGGGSLVISAENIISNTGTFTSNGGAGVSGSTACTTSGAGGKGYSLIIDR